MNEILYEGKSKIIYPGPDGKSFIMRYKDTATAFNGEKKEDLDGKGRLNSAISNFIYRYLADNGIKTHLIRELDETTVMVKKAEIIMVEVIVRNVAAGSFSKRFGVEEGTELKNTVVEYSLKSDSLGDPMINISQITALGLAEKNEMDFLYSQALKINSLLCGLFLKAGIRLIDFKLEFGRCEDDDIILCDEISPDSCRFWDAATGEKMDKDRFRRDMGKVLDGYSTVLERLRNVS